MRQRVFFVGSEREQLVISAQHLISRQLIPDSLKIRHALYLVPLFALSCHFQAHILATQKTVACVFMHEEH